MSENDPPPGRAGRRTHPRDAHSCAYYRPSDGLQVHVGGDDPDRPPVLRVARGSPGWSSRQIAADLRPPGLLCLRSRSFQEGQQAAGIRHILAAPFHPRTNGKMERYHQTLKRGVNQTPYDVPEDLETAIGDFVSYNSFRRYHRALGDATPVDVPAGRQEEILRGRKEVKVRTIE